MQEKEFKVFNLEMERISVFYGLFLVAWGLVISFLSQSDSMTSYIPSFLGLPILLFGYLTLKFPEKKKLFMHIIVLLGIIIFFGGVESLGFHTAPGVAPAWPLQLRWRGRRWPDWQVRQPHLDLSRQGGGAHPWRQLLRYYPPGTRELFIVLILRPKKFDYLKTIFVYYIFIFAPKLHDQKSLLDP